MGAVAWVVLAYLAVSFFGYWVHRGLHRPWSGALHRAHLQHHTVHYPPGRLVSGSYDAARWWQSGTFLFAPPLLLLVAGALALGLPWSFCAAAVGFALLSDYVHDGFHLERPLLQRLAWYRRLREAHFEHHRRMRANLGITSLFWDRAFGTRSRRA